MQTKGIRHADEAFFERSGIRDSLVHPHNPIIVIGQDGIVSSETDLTNLVTRTDNPTCIMQWKGVKRSDYFEFELEVFKQHIQKFPANEVQLI